MSVMQICRIGGIKWNIKSSFLDKGGEKSELQSLKSRPVYLKPKTSGRGIFLPWCYCCCHHTIVMGRDVSYA